jgi:hypothetical protein
VPSVFHRTPKYHGRDTAEAPPAYRIRSGIAKWWWTEVALGLYVAVALGYAAASSVYSVVPFLLPLSAGFLYAGLSSRAPLQLDRPLPLLADASPDPGASSPAVPAPGAPTT